MLADGKGGFDSLHGRAWIYTLLHPLSRYSFVGDFVVQCKMTLIFFGRPELVFIQVAGQFLKGEQHRLTRVCERDVINCKGRVALHVVGDGYNFSMISFNS